MIRVQLTPAIEKQMRDAFGRDAEFGINGAKNGSLWVFRNPNGTHRIIRPDTIKLYK